MTGLIVFSAFYLWSGKAKALTAGPNYNASAVSDASIGSIAWTNPGNATGTSDGVYASATKSGLGIALTQYLDFTNLGFGIPSSAVVGGVEAEIYAHYTKVGGLISECGDNNVELIKNGIVGSNDQSTYSWGTTDAWMAYGSSTDTWGQTLSGTDVDASNFGFAVSATALVSTGGTSVTCYVDAARVTLTYTVPNNSPAAPTLSAPSNTATITTTTPQFQLKTTDTESDYLDYAVQLCSDSSCTSVVQTYCQVNFNSCTGSQTGWSGQDANGGTAYTGSSSLGGSTLASFQPTSGLTPNVTYYWQGFAIDPGGSDSWSAGSSIWSFKIENAPAAPTLSAPSNGATGQGTSPSFQLRATDADSDYLEYKIQLCQNISCSTVLNTWDETSSQTGWSGQDANGGTAYTGSSSLGGSTLATYSATSPLSTNTTYYWRAYAIDPGGTDTFSPASSIFSFTTTSSAVQINGGTAIKGGSLIQ